MHANGPAVCLGFNSVLSYASRLQEILEASQELLQNIGMVSSAITIYSYNLILNH